MGVLVDDVSGEIIRDQLDPFPMSRTMYGRLGEKATDSMNSANRTRTMVAPEAMSNPQERKSPVTTEVTAAMREIAITAR